MKQQPQIVGILGGMGPAAGADFVRLFVNACAQTMSQRGQPVTDQAFPEHWLAQLPIPDRTAALLNPAQGAHQPLEPMLQALGRMTALGVRSVAIACNTAHAWHAALQEKFPQLELLHVMQETAAHLTKQGVPRAALLATDGTYQTGLYERVLREAGIACFNPEPAQKKILMQGIFDGIKADNFALAQACFLQVIEHMTKQHGALSFIMGCTEIPLGLQSPELHKKYALLNPSAILAQALADRVYRHSVG